MSVMSRSAAHFTHRMLLDHRRPSHNDLKSVASQQGYTAHEPSSPLHSITPPSVHSDDDVLDTFSCTTYTSTTRLAS
jgi:hypothetical protein